MDIALLVARLVIGLGMAVHGAQKLFGSFGGSGLEGMGEFFGGMGFRPGRLFAFSAGAAELGGGLLIALGLFGPVGPAIMTVVMVVAIITVHRENGFLAMNNGFELPLLYVMAGLILAFTGPGAYSLDALLFPGWSWSPSTVWILFGCALLAAAANLLLRRPPAEEARVAPDATSP